MRPVVAILVPVLLAVPVYGYSVLTHEAIVDTLWNDSIIPVLEARFPDATADQLAEAHAYVYGGCIIQDLGYYPFGSHQFSDLTHYVRTADFIQALVDNASILDELAFALGAAAHYAADVDGHRIAVNRAVPILYPNLKRKFGDEVTYGDDHASHLRTEFGFDVLQVARGHYAPDAYHGFVGFQVSKALLEKAFEQTYGLRLEDVFKSLDLSLATYRWSVTTMIPEATKAAWALKKDEIEREQPAVTRRQFLYNIDRASYVKEWPESYQQPGIGARIIAFCVRIIPKVGPLSGLAFRVPTPETEKLFEDSFDTVVTQDRNEFAQMKDGVFRVPNRDLDTGAHISRGEYALTDRTYDQLLKKIASKRFDGVTPALRENILAFYARKNEPDPHGTAAALQELKAFKPSAGSQ